MIYVHIGILCAHWHLMCTLVSYVHIGILCAHWHLMCTLASYVHTYNNHTWRIVTCLLPTVYDDHPLSLRLPALRISPLDFLIPDYRPTVPSVFSQNLSLSVQCLWLTQTSLLIPDRLKSYQLFLLNCDRSEKSVFNCSDWSGNGRGSSVIGWTVFKEYSVTFFG